MKIGNNFNQNFKGRFYLTTDSHSRLPILSGVLSEIENRSKNCKAPQFYIDGGDFVGDTYTHEEVFDVFNKFHKNNPKIPMIFNLGNLEILCTIFQHNSPEKILKKFANAGMKLVSLTMIDELKKANKNHDYMLPYIIIEDESNGEKEKILITGLCKSEKEDIKGVLKHNFLPVYEKENPDKVFLLMHMLTKDTKETLDYAKEIGIDNIALVVGGHPHTIEDYTYNGTKILYPPAQGKGAFIIENSKKGIDFHDFTRNPRNGYDYSPILNNPSVIDNINIFKPKKLNKDYEEIIEKSESSKKLQEKITTAPFGLKFRNEYDFELARPTELGTFVANAYRDQTNADIGLLLSMDIRESAPPKNHEITFYNIADILNVNKPLYKYESINADTLKEFLEISLKEQSDGITCKNFIEYSDNLKVARYTNARKDEPKIAQIYIKKNGVFTPLLDENQKQLSDERFSVTTCQYIANEKKARPALALFKNYPSHIIENATGRSVFVKQYKKAVEEGLKTFKEAEIEDIELPEN